MGSDNIPFINTFSNITLNISIKFIKEYETLQNLMEASGVLSSVEKLNKTSILSRKAWQNTWTRAFNTAELIVSITSFAEPRTTEKNPLLFLILSVNSFIT